MISDAQPECQVLLHHLVGTNSFSFFHCEGVYWDPIQALILLSFSLPYNYSHDVFPRAFRETGLCLYLIPSLWVSDHLYLLESLGHNICLFFPFVMLQTYLLFDCLSGI